MDVRAAEISAILKEQIKGFGTEAQVADVGRVLSVASGDVPPCKSLLSQSREPGKEMLPEW